MIEQYCDGITELSKAMTLKQKDLARTYLDFWGVIYRQITQRELANLI